MVSTVKSTPAFGVVLEGAFETIEDVTGQVITVQRLPGDQLTADLVGDAVQNALAQALDPDHPAVVIHVDQASGLVGLAGSRAHFRATDDINGEGDCRCIPTANDVDASGGGSQDKFWIKT